MKKRFVNHGQSLAEFALTLPLLLLIIFMIFDLGRAVYYFSAINHGAHEGARYGAVSYSITNEAEIKNRIENAAVGIGDEINYGSSPCVCFDSNDRAHLHVSLGYDFEPATPLVGSFLGVDGKIHLDADSNMVIEFPIDSVNDSYNACQLSDGTPTDYSGSCETLWQE